MLNSILAQSSTTATPSGTSSSIEFDWPYFWTDWLPIVLLLLAIGTTLYFVFRDTKQFNRGWTILLTTLRLAFLTLGLIMALNPHERTQTDTHRPSRVIFLVDTSTSMQQPVRDPRSAGAESVPTRSEAILELLGESPLLERLRADHSVDLFTFSDDLSQLKARFPTNASPADGAQPNAQQTGEANGSDSPQEEKIVWDEILKTDGHLTRLGDSLDKLLVEAKTSTLSGIVVISDGATNAGRDISAARDRATEYGVRLVSVGVGSTEPPQNLEVARLIAPTDVQKGDAFELSAILRGQGVAGKSAQVDLLQKGPNDPEPIVVLTETRTISEDGTPTEVLFDLKPSDGGEYQFTVRASLSGGNETRQEDNQLSRSVNIFDRPLKVLVIAGGPMRDYRFAKTALYRHPSILTDIWLQTGSVGISQESNRLLFRFPEDRESLYEYDAIIAFDVDWSQVSEEQRGLLTDWISNEGGGLFVVAGDVNTPQLAASEEFEKIKRLYPVLLEEVSLRLGNRDAASTAFPIGFTQDGEVAEFLKLAETGDESAWAQFPGVYRTYPTRGAKAGTTIFAEFTDPLSRGPGGQPVLLAAQRFGQGQVLYLGSPEMWRLRSVDESYYERFWIKSVRKAAEGRSKRGLQRSLFILDGTEFELGQTVPLRVRSVTPQFEPLVSEEIPLELYGPNGSPILPGPVLVRDPLRPEEFVGDYRPLVAGAYRFEYQVPESSDRIQQNIEVQFPRQEAASLVQEVEQLRRLVEGTGGEYVTLEEAVAAVPKLLPNKGESVTIDQKIEELWDRKFLMFLMVLLVSAEWLTRKLLKLA
ncbi:hypothetical protein [Thalassoglobus sp.]|uniref:hypothetical protein n=1 Tax=Thalassoglobus sp. TaxID=2795869 RepID=UPI003AA7C707